MEYDIERSKREQAEIRQEFRKLFPLANEHDLPWAACQIGTFLRDRIEQEAQERVFHWQAGIVRVLAEVSPPKTHAVDMARIVVEKAKQARNQEELAGEIRDLKKERESLLECVRHIGKLVGCNHTEDPDGWNKLVHCVAETLGSRQEMT